MEPEEARREDSRHGRRRRCHGRLLGAGTDQPNHCHPDATEIYFCFSGGGEMWTPTQTVDVVPGAFVVHPPGELHEYRNGPARTLLFRVRYGADMASRHFNWPSNPDWKQKPADAEYFRQHPPA